ncbi:microsomal glutathione S-transferase 1-like [Neocloeon triangulifer]|uniref:microsomal glutathione S-transferase 1-like n=1 Tax=Neocloeon triangulifer TaxID=2078957 RepID=UPI00286EEA03|nr:microsomal glutathione S-transferase 1-like [Neocloeon triangulifer]
MGFDLSRDNPLFALYAVHATILVLKMFLVTFLTGRQRFSKKAFANPEDVKGKAAKVKLDDPDVERVRRAHLNDLENIPAFLFVSFLYVLTSPDLGLATNLFRAFTIARIVHTFVYAVKPLPQPSRALAFGVGLITTAYMALRVLLYFW